MTAKGKKQTRKWDRGRPRHVPTPETRAQVSAYQIVGVQHHEISALMGISTPTLLKYYKNELALALNRANAVVNQRLFAQTKTNVAAAIFWHKAKMGWRETQAVVHQGDELHPVVTKQLPENATLEEATAAYMELLGKKS